MLYKSNSVKVKLTKYAGWDPYGMNNALIMWFQRRAYTVVIKFQSNCASNYCSRFMCSIFHEC